MRSFLKNFTVRTVTSFDIPIIFHSACVLTPKQTAIVRKANKRFNKPTFLSEVNQRSCIESITFPLAYYSNPLLELFDTNVFPDLIKCSQSMLTMYT